MAWYSKAGGGKIESHKQKLWAISRCNIHAGAGGEPVEALGVYRRDPSKYPDEPNLLPGLIAAAQSKKIAADIRAIMAKGRRRTKE